MLRKLKIQGVPRAARYDWSQGPAVEKHCCRVQTVRFLIVQFTMAYSHSCLLSPNILLINLFWRIFNECWPLWARDWVSRQFKTLSVVCRIWGSHIGGYEVDIMLCSLLIINQRFRGTCRLHLQGWGISQARNQHEAAGKQIFNRLHSIISQKIELFSIYRRFRELF
jgi:hypothetical protein